MWTESETRFWLRPFVTSLAVQAKRDERKNLTVHTHSRGILAEVLRHLLPTNFRQEWPGVELRLHQPPAPGCRVVLVQYDSMEFVLLYGFEALAFLVGATSGVFDLMARSTLLTQSDWARPVATSLLVAGIVAGTRGSRRPGRRAITDL